ncbi:type VII secretion-associated serine protease mycosin [Streptomyces palmae]|uniref:type VII secretion-associated serine protease mycosin n=1 Tax=Streptomyces palmae TaxID=1701085 RepID=UPI003CC911C9
MPRTKLGGGLAAAALLALTATAGAGQAAHAAPAGPDLTHPGPRLDGDGEIDGNGECTYPMKKQIKGTPWALQRLVLDQLWRDTKGRDPQGRPVRVAVIDSGVDNDNPQLKSAVDASSGMDYLPADKSDQPPPQDTGEADAKDEKDQKGKKEKQQPPPPPPPPRDGTDDTVGHGTKVAGIIAARPNPGTGFVGLAPEAQIIPLKQSDDKGNGTPQTMAQAIHKAVEEGAKVINISQDTVGARPSVVLEAAVRYALDHDVVVVAAAGNDGADGKSKRTYPASIPGVLAVAASDRNNERAYFSQSGDFVGVAAPGVEMVSTVPKYGQCVDNGTSFSTPYVAGLAALIRAKHPDWKQHQVVAQIEQTAERGVNGRDRYVGWGVVDPVRAMTEDDHPIDKPTAGTAHRDIAAPAAQPLIIGETPQQRRERYATYALGGVIATAAVITGTTLVARDGRRRRARRDVP